MGAKAVIAFVLCAVPAMAQGQNATVEAITAALNRAVSNTTNRGFGLCQLRAAIWGAYNVRVFMPRSSTTGNQALIFRITDGVFYQEVNPSPSGSTNATADREGIVFLPSREAAFASGVPFYIGDASFDNPTTIRYTVYSNPAIATPAAFGSYESISSITRVQIVDTPNPFASATQPSTRTFRLNTALSPTGEYYLSAVTSSGGGQYCLASNEFELLAVTVSTPWIRRRLPVLQAFSNAGRLSSGTWIQVFGYRLSTTTRLWRGEDFEGSQAPVSLDGVRVSLNGKPAAVSYISPSQVNAQVPDDLPDGPVEVDVTNSLGSSHKVSATKGRVSPALLTTPAFLVEGKQYLAALFPDFATFVGPENLIAGVPFRPARPGDTIVAYAVGCGPTAPLTPAGLVVPEARPLASAFEFRIGDTPAEAQGFLAPQAVGLCQFNVVVPSLSDGDHRVTLSISGVEIGQILFTSVKR